MHLIWNMDCCGKRGLYALDNCVICNYADKFP
jgi:hypothetical protein